MKLHKNVWNILYTDFTPPPLFRNEIDTVIKYIYVYFRKSLYPRPRRGVSARDSGNIDLILYGNYSQEQIQSDVPVSTTRNSVILHTIRKQKTNISGYMSKSAETYTINDEGTTPLKSKKFEWLYIMYLA